MKRTVTRKAVIAASGLILLTLMVVGVWAQVTGDTPSGTTEAGEAGVAAPEKDTIELHVKETDLSSVLKLLADQRQLNIVAGKDVTGKVTADLYGVSLDEALYAVLEMNGYGYRREGNFVYIYTKEQLATMTAAEAKTDTRIFVLNYMNVTEAQALIKPVLSTSAIVAATSRAKMGIPSGGEDVEGDTYCLQDKLVITDLVENLDRVAALLAKLDTRPQQVLVEATILQVTLDDEASLGVDFNILAGIDFRQISAADFSLANPNSIVTTAGTTGNVAQLPWGRVGTTGFATAGTGLQVGVVTNDVSFFIQALEAVEDINILSNPKVLALNKQRAEVIVGERLGYRTTTTTATSEIENVEFLDTGTQLQFRPYISQDGFIRMEIHPEVSTGQIDALGLPSERTTEVTCNIMVRDGHTVVIGGLFDETSQITKSMVPGLGNIPGLGALFRSDSHETMRREIIVLLTPHIIDDATSNVEGRETLAEAERYVTGIRSRFPLYTREKLTQVYMAEADDCYNRYLLTGDERDRKTTLWNLKQSRHISPNNLEVHKRIDALEADQGSRRPRLTAESVLWKRMLRHGLLDDVRPAAPHGRRSPGGQQGTDADKGGER